MTIEKLKISLLSEAQKEADGVLNEARAQAKKMLDDEQMKSEAMKADAGRTIQKLLEEQKNERLAWARLESKRIGAEARDDAINVVLDDLMEILGSMRKSPEYKAWMKGEVEKAVNELGSSTIVHVKQGDKDLISKVKGVSVIEDLDGLGGAIIEKEDGRVRIDATVETLVETKRDEFRSKINEKLFGGSK